MVAVNLPYTVELIEHIIAKAGRLVDSRVGQLRFGKLVAAVFSKVFLLAWLEADLECKGLASTFVLI